MANVVTLNDVNDKHFGLELSRVSKGMYRRDKLEYVFNAPENSHGAN